MALFGQRVNVGQCVNEIMKMVELLSTECEPVRDC